MRWMPRICGAPQDTLLWIRREMTLSAAGVGEGVMGHERDERQMASPLDCHSKRPLVLRTDPRSAAGLDLCPVGNKPPNLVNVLVVDELDMFHAEGADTATGNEPPPGPPTRSSAGSGSSRSSAGTPASRPGGAPSLWPVRRSVCRFSCHIYSVPKCLRKA